MGEYAKRLSDGEEVKIGTCENMYYLRADQRHLVDYSDWNLDADRFRFPFPDEDGTAPGGFSDHDRSFQHSITIVGLVLEWQRLLLLQLSKR